MNLKLIIALALLVIWAIAALVLQGLWVVRTRRLREIAIVALLGGNREDVAARRKRRARSCR